MDSMQGDIVFIFFGLAIREVVMTTWGIMALLVLISVAVTRHLLPMPGKTQTLIEAAVLAIDEAIRTVNPGGAEKILPLIATLWLFLATANLLGVIPGLHSPTRDLSVTTALALVVFASVHYFGVTTLGRGYFAHYLRPSPILLPFHLISEATRTLALAVRLFGNMMSLEIAALLILMVAGFLAPVPILMLHIIEALVQAYIFGMLALIYVSGAMQREGE